MEAAGRTSGAASRLKLGARGCGRLSVADGCLSWVCCSAAALPSSWACCAAAAQQKLRRTFNVTPEAVDEHGRDPTTGSGPKEAVADVAADRPETSSGFRDAAVSSHHDAEHDILKKTSTIQDRISQLVQESGLESHASSAEKTAPRLRNLRREGAGSALDHTTRRTPTTKTLVDDEEAEEPESSGKDQERLGGFTSKTDRSAGCKEAPLGIIYTTCSHLSV